ncbi:MAG: T9SS type A sorting domain-containing protein [Bacteroidia bacterium]|nr:T9SS type A sorting domain-containing protein [Bacteroidia bacterium]
MLLFQIPCFKTPDDPAPSFVLLVGDIEQIPSFDGISDSHKSDMYYCEYDGNGDYFPDVYYGRFSAQNSSQLQPQIEKTLQYEQYLMPDPSFLDEVVMVAGVDDNFAPVWGNGQINYGTDNYFNAAHGLTSHTYLYETGSPITSDSSIASAAIIQDVSNGVGFANYTAHGGTIGWADPSFLTYDIPGLQNSDKYPLMIGNCCVSNTFSEPECFGEALLRANKKGAIGYIGGSNSTLWDEDYYWGVGAKEIILNPPYEANALGSYDRIFHDHGEPESDWYITNAQMNFAGNLAVSQSSSSYDLYYWEIYHLMGDPSVMTYFSVPPPLTISYLNTIIIGTPTLTVTTEPNTYVAISYNNVLYDAQFSGSSGIVTLNTSDILTYCVANLVATKQNRQPHIGTVTVVPGTTAYIIYYSHAIDDAGGNNNFQADYAENILLNLSLKNVGPLEADSVVVTLSSNDGNIVFTDNVQQWNNIPGDSVSSINGAFSFTVNDDVTDQHNVIFNLTITDINDSIWQSSFSIPLNAPELSVDFVSINDPSGNNNGSLDPGETADINIDVNNTGHSISLPAYCLLSSTSGYVTIITDSIYLGILNINSPVQDAFIISIDSLTLIGSYIDLTFQLVAGQYSATSTVILKVGLVCEDWESNSFSMYDWENGGDIPWTITSGNPYEGSFAAVSGAIGDMESSVLSITLYVLNDDSISFYKKVSSEQYYDFLFFYIDNEPVGSWSGEVDWSLSQYPVPAGQHTFKWQYSKDYYYATGGDNAMLDYIVWPTFDMSGNNIPVFVSTPVIIATPSLPYSYDIVVNDIDADDLTISAPTLPTWLTLFDNGDGTAALNGTPDSSNIGHNQVVLSAYDGIATIYQNFTIEIGVPTENWESGDFENFPWEVSGNQPWTITTGNPYEGSFSAKSGAIGDGQTSVLSIDLNIPADDQITFFKKVSCESPYFYVGNWYYWDYLEFLIDDNSIGMWAGEIDWSIEQYPVEQGLHTFKWVYSKDSSYIGGSDCAWLDFIVFPILELPTGKNEFISTDTLTLNIYPNPAKEQATIFYTVPVNRYIEIAIFNLLGEKIMTLVNQNVNKGIYTINLDTKLFNNGIYYCRLFADEQCITK